MKTSICALFWLAAVTFAGPAFASTTYHGTFVDGATACQGIWSSAADGTVGGTWNLNVKNDGQAEISIVIFRDGKQQANWALVPWIPTTNNDPGVFYEYVAVLSPFLSLYASYDPVGDEFIFQAFHPTACIGAYHADQVRFTGTADRGGNLK
jgi:hypothetical protein